jgi:hypothetical protein
MREAPLLAFEWQWVAQHVSMAIVTNSADHERLVGSYAYPPSRVFLSHPASTPSPVVALYRRLHDAGTTSPPRRYGTSLLEGGRASEV